MDPPLRPPAGEGPAPWDFGVALAQVLLQHHPIGQPVLDGDAHEDFYDGLVWYFGETLRRGKPSRWRLRQRTDADPKPTTGGDSRPCAEVTVATRAAHDKRLAVYLVQELDCAVGAPRGLPGQPIPKARPDWLRDTYEYWIRGPIEERTDRSLRRRESVKARLWRTLDDDQFLTRWLAARRAGFDEWALRYDADVDWDLRPDGLEDLEARVWQLGGPEGLLEDPDPKAFTDGAIWYLGELLLRSAPPESSHWTYFRGWSDPYVRLKHDYSYEPIRALPQVYADVAGRGGILRALHRRSLAALG